MIDVRELRIGNYFNDPENGDCQVEQIATYSSKSDNIGVIYRNRSCWCELDGIHPIPLTPERLERMGFLGNIEDGYGLDVCELNHITTEDNFQYEVVTPMKNGRYTYTLVDIKYVHQLQNLYFGLTGKELEIKP